MAESREGGAAQGWRVPTPRRGHLAKPLPLLTAAASAPASVRGWPLHQEAPSLSRCRPLIRALEPLLLRRSLPGLCPARHSFPHSDHSGAEAQVQQLVDGAQQLRVEGSLGDDGHQPGR